MSKPSKPAELDETISDENSSEEEENNESIPDELKNLMEAMPDEDKEKLLSIMVSQEMGMIGRMVSRGNPMAEKINEAHIDKVLSIAEKKTDQEYKLTVDSRRINLVIIAIIMIFIIALVFILKDNGDLLMKLLQMFVPAVLGFAGGYGIKSFQDKKEE